MLIVHWHGDHNVTLNPHAKAQMHMWFFSIGLWAWMNWMSVFKKMNCHLPLLEIKNKEVWTKLTKGKDLHCVSHHTTEWMTMRRLCAAVAAHTENIWQRWTLSHPEIVAWKIPNASTLKHVSKGDIAQNIIMTVTLTFDLTTLWFCSMSTTKKIWKD